MRNSRKLLHKDFLYNICNSYFNIIFYQMCLADPRQKSVSMALVPLQPRQKSVSVASGDNRGQKAPPFGLVPICLGYKT